MYFETLYLLREKPQSEIFDGSIDDYNRPYILSLGYRWHTTLDIYSWLAGNNIGWGNLNLIDHCSIAD